MSESETRHDPRRIVKEIVVRYRMAGESSDRPLREFRVWHKQDGAEIDTITWSGKLLGKMRYLEQDGSHSKPTIRTDGKDWETDLEEESSPAALRADAPRPNHCVWFHDEQCSWWSYCGRT